MPTSVWIRLSSNCIWRRSLRSSAPSGSSSRSSLGRLTSARITAMRCCWPPESWVGLRLASCCISTSFEHLVDAPVDVALLAAAQAERHVLEDRHVREQRVALEYGVDRPLVGPLVGDLFRRRSRSDRQWDLRARRSFGAWWFFHSRTARAARRSAPPEHPDRCRPPHGTGRSACGVRGRAVRYRSIRRWPRRWPRRFRRRWSFPHAPVSLANSRLQRFSWSSVKPMKTWVLAKSAADGKTNGFSSRSGSRSCMALSVPTTGEM